MPLIKVCGNLYPMDAHMVAGFQPDFMGWIFVPASPRCGIPERTSRLIQQIRISHPLISHVAVIGGMGQYELIRLLRRLSPGGVPVVDALQVIGSSMHLEHTSQLLMRWGWNLPIWPVLRVDASTELSDPHHRRSPMYVVDRKMDHALGGTGKLVDLDWVKDLTVPFLLAGGLNHENALDRCAKSNALGVDISSGLETGIPGRKDLEKLRALFAAFHRY
ncbi:MAG: phosphoribosylanthranilate isomerase [Leptospiraceae bacterium]|nr:phosphoribosylanthranilate isomerase [Leptospiraceae bacterium]MCB1303115.1 phosphoribosylanthranilate isomerase [Leptospiraceae bacterium]